MALGHGIVSTSVRTVWGSCAVLLVLCLVVGLQTVRSDNYFLGDDFGLVQHLHDLPVERLASYFVSDWTEGIYGAVLDELRPFLAFSYWLDARLYGPLNVGGYHVTNLVLHFLNALLVLAIARSVIPGKPGVALLAATLFVLMPSHAEPIAWISGRVDSLASLFCLGAFLCFVRFRLGNRPAWLFGALLAFAFGLFAKQSLVVFPLLILAFDLLGPRSADSPGGRWRARLWVHAPFFLLSVAYMGFRYLLFGNAVREDVLTAAMIEAFVYRQDGYARELLPTPNAAPRAIKLFGEVVTVAVLAVCGRWLFARRRACADAVSHLRYFGAAWYCVTIAPMVVTYSSARHLYITTAGLSIALASLLLPGDPVEARSRTRTRMAMVATLIVLYAMTAIWNVSTWVTRGTESQRFASAIPRLLQSVPRGSVVLISAPEFRDGWFWSWATPFALQPPFTSEDLYKSFSIVERPPIYCCPPDQWWAARKPAVMVLLDSPVPQQVTAITFAPDDPAVAAFSTRTIDGPASRRRIESALGRPIESFTGTPAEVTELSRVLFE